MLSGPLLLIFNQTTAKPCGKYLEIKLLKGKKMLIPQVRIFKPNKKMEKNGILLTANSKTKTKSEI